MQRVILANARYWLDYLKAAPEDTPRADADTGTARALEAAIAIRRLGHWRRYLPCGGAPSHGTAGALVRVGWHAGAPGHPAGAQSDSAAEAELLLHGAIQQRRGAYGAAILSYRQRMAACRRMGDRPGLARALSNLGSLYRQQGSFQRALVLCRGALALFEALGDTIGLARTENHLGLLYLDQRCWAEASSHFTRSKALLQEAGDQYGLAKTLQNLGVLHESIGELDTALDYLTQARQLYQALGDEIHAARTLLNMGNVYLSREDLPEAEIAYSQAEALLYRR